uniref:NADH dehydrogenase subunit 4L n=1 Tax=Euphaedusa digonoptyx comes TaxID=1885678 RepID=A0A224ABI3_9EUPU|nr:NADH dehydrogenase subunit 4L [Euphaedusa digonoptyx comes]
MAILIMYTLLMMVMLSVFFKSKKHFMNALLCLEAMALILILSCLSLLYLIMDGYTFFLVLLTFSVIEASVALTLLISFGKIYGNDYISTTFNNY